jgi:hypothetical protein
MRSVLWAAAALLLIVGAFFLTMILVVESKVVYRRYFGDDCLEIRLSGEIDYDGTRHRTLVTAYYDPPSLMHPTCGVAFRTPDARKPKFESVYDEPSSLLCVYDTNGWGYIAIVNTRRKDGFSAPSMPYFTEDTIDWRDEFDLLKAKYPELPYAEVFEYAEKRLRENTE